MPPQAIRPPGSRTRSERRSVRTSEVGATCAASWTTGPAEGGEPVERLGDALKRLRLQGTTSKLATVGSFPADLPDDDPPSCPRCRGAGFLRRDVPAGHAEFGQVVVCSCKKQEVA